MAEVDYFSSRKTSAENYKKFSTPRPVPKHCLGFSYKRWEYYELDLKFDETEMKSKSDSSYNDKVELFHKNMWS